MASIMVPVIAQGYMGRLARIRGVVLSSDQSERTLWPSCTALVRFWPSAGASTEPRTGTWETLQKSCSSIIESAGAPRGLAPFQEVPCSGVARQAYARTARGH